MMSLHPALQVSGGVTERSRLLAQLTEDLEAVKTEMEEVVTWKNQQNYHDWKKAVIVQSLH